MRRAVAGGRRGRREVLGLIRRVLLLLLAVGGLLAVGLLLGRGRLAVARLGAYCCGGGGGGAP